VKNPYEQREADAGRIPGGSSGRRRRRSPAGAFVTCEQGTDTGGSTRIPAGTDGQCVALRPLGQHGGAQRRYNDADMVSRISNTRDNVGRWPQGGGEFWRCSRSVITGTTDG